MTQTPAAKPQDDDLAAQDSLADDLTDALIDGDRTLTPGTARSAFSHATFRTVYLGAFASNIGTWMQNVVLAALAYTLTKSALFVGIIGFAQLAPLLMFSVVGGMLADAFDRKKLLVILSLQQAAFSLILAVVTLPSSPSRVLMVATVFCIGVGNALYAPIFSAVVPVLVPRPDIGGAISLNSIQMNASRVIGPIIGTTIYALSGHPSPVFVVNAFSFGFVILSLTRITLPPPPAAGGRGLHRLLEGFQVARSDRVVGQTLVVISLFSFFSLPFITQLSKLAADNLGIAPKSSGFGFLYASFGIGAVIGALSIGTIFAQASKPRLTRIGLVVFAAMLLVFGSLHSAALAYLAILLLGCVYFAVITSLSTVLQQDLDDAVRGKVMALWIMGFGGTVPFGGLAGGWAMEHVGIMPVLVVGATVAVLLAWYADMRQP